ncbi:MAG: hypothetical protein DMG05_17710 [Acidobacteria bacterium]|nr:MAG: hypothetical protein DMG05_17710 [Acidobacteriota bacterium]
MKEETGTPRQGEHLCFNARLSSLHHLLSPLWIADIGDPPNRGIRDAGLAFPANHDDYSKGRLPVAVSGRQSLEVLAGVMGWARGRDESGGADGVFSHRAKRQEDSSPKVETEQIGPTSSC